MSAAPHDPTPPRSDEDLVRRSRDGDESAARELFDRHVAELRSRVRAWLPLLLRRKVAESDVIQEAYLTAYLRLGEFEDRGDGSFARWVSRILENKVHDEIRRHLGTEMRAARREVDVASSQVDAPSPVAPGPSPSSAAVGKEVHADVRRLVADLPEAQRTLLEMVHLRHLNLREVAELTGKSYDSVRQAYSRALRAFACEVRMRSDLNRPGE